MTSRVIARRPGLSVLVALAMVAAGLGRRIQGTEQAAATPPPPASRAARMDTVAVTPVQGPSTLHHLGLTIEHSSMGWEGQWGPPPTTVPQEPAGRTRRLDDPSVGFVLSGADLYRVSCRACHKADGTGGPPEINSIIGPVQSASVEWMTRRMKEMGRTVAPSFIRELTTGTEADLRKRLKAGGHTMPSFAHLSDREIQVLRPYLDQMAGIPGAERKQREMTEPGIRVGELIVKGTCHICHDATGPDDKPTTALNRVIPSLASISHVKTQPQLMVKVHEGAPIPLGTGSVMSRGRMPVFNYLSEPEIAAAYSYLMAYPPQ